MPTRGREDLGKLDCMPRRSLEDVRNPTLKQFEVEKYPENLIRSRFEAKKSYKIPSLPVPRQYHVGSLRLTTALRRSRTLFPDSRVSLRKIFRKKPNLQKQLPDVPRTSGSKSGPNSTRRNPAVTTRDLVVGPNGFKRTSGNSENP